MKADQLNGANLAYIGDAYFELHPKYLLSRELPTKTSSISAPSGT